MVKQILIALIAVIIFLGALPWEWHRHWPEHEIVVTKEEKEAVLKRENDAKLLYVWGEIK